VSVAVPAGVRSALARIRLGWARRRFVGVWIDLPSSDADAQVVPWMRVWPSGGTGAAAVTEGGLAQFDRVAMAALLAACDHADDPVAVVDASNVRGIGSTIATHQPIVVLDPSRLTDEGAAVLRSLLRAHGYRAYRLATKPSWRPSRRWHEIRPRNDDRSWLFYPGGLPVGFSETFDLWWAELSACDGVEFRGAWTGVRLRRLVASLRRSDLVVGPVRAARGTLRSWRGRAEGLLRLRPSE
jgi:hypothetical protein